ncbi:cysteine hydrolase family protein [Anaeroselena agilis]|uniref:Cysteine hydrolase family protein n=1 Tax=Anaeroselena agilis TaxID=3063788 RepID=A0ABU3P381_9FIRM|nr:cysteine hydrolase family protein [Selenomonadales bacterium 4137-cl]
MNRLPADAALLVVDVQKAIDDPVWAKHGPRNNPGAEENIAALLAAWRRTGRKIVHVRHESTEPGSTYRPGQPGCEFKPCAAPQPGEQVVVKNVNSAFIGTGLEQTIRAAGTACLVVCGVITNNSVEATVRMAGNLGFDTWLVHDAAFTFARPDYEGRLRSAAEVHAMSLANLAGEYCRIVTTGEMLAKI